MVITEKYGAISAIDCCRCDSCWCNRGLEGSGIAECNGTLSTEISFCKSEMCTRSALLPQDTQTQTSRTAER
jgi:hypothetical protein